MFTVRSSEPPVIGDRTQGSATRGRSDGRPGRFFDTSWARVMADVTLRTDNASRQALSELVDDGATASEAIRRALVDAVRLRRREQMRVESPASSQDESELAESRRVRADMNALRAW